MPASQEPQLSAANSSPITWKARPARPSGFELHSRYWQARGFSLTLAAYATFQASLLRRSRFDLHWFDLWCFDAYSFHHEIYHGCLGANSVHCGADPEFTLPH